MEEEPSPLTWISIMSIHSSLCSCGYYISTTIKYIFDYKEHTYIYDRILSYVSLLFYVSDDNMIRGGDLLHKLICFQILQAYTLYVHTYNESFTSLQVACDQDRLS